MAMNYFDLLPSELTVLILRNLSIRDMIRLGRECHYFNSFVQSWSFWANKAQYLFGFPRAQFLQKRYDNQSEVSWYWLLESDAFEKVVIDNQISPVQTMISQGALIWDEGFIAAMFCENIPMLDCLFSGRQRPPPLVLFAEWIEYAHNNHKVGVHNCESCSILHP